MIFSAVFFKKNGKFLEIKSFYPITLEQLFQESFNTKIVPNQTQIKFLGNSFVLNPHRDPRIFDKLLKLAKGTKFEKVLAFIKSKIGFYTQFRLRHSVATRIKIMSRVNYLKEFIEKGEEKISNIKSVVKLKIMDGKKLNDISKQLKISKNNIKKILRKVRYSKRSIQEILNPTHLEPSKIFVENVPKLLSFYRRVSFCNLSLRDQYTKFKDLNKRNEIVSFPTFVNFVKKYFRLRKITINRIGASMDQMDLRHTRKIVSCTLIYLLIKQINLIFFDISSICERDYQKRIWSIGGEKRSNLKIGKFSKQAKILMCCNTNSIMSYAISKRGNKQTIGWFLNESIKHFRTKLKMKKMVFFVDNATPHHSELIKQLFSEKRVYVLFNAPNSSKTNQIENVFEVMKRPIRGRITKGWQENIMRVAEELVERIRELDLCNQTHKWLMEIDRAISLSRMW